MPDAREILGDIWHVGKLSHPRRVQKVERQAEKRAIEVARYVLPVAAATTMVHTLSRHRAPPIVADADASDTPAESRAVVGEMVEQVRELDPQFFERFDNEPMETLPEWEHNRRQTQDGEAFAREFDAKLEGASRSWWIGRRARRVCSRMRTARS